MTEKQREAKEAVERFKGDRGKAAEFLGITRKALTKRLLAAQEVSVEEGEQEEKVESTPGGFSLTGKVLLATKPTDVWKARFNALKPGKGYTLEYLADQWGNSIDTIRSKAKRFGSLRYVEDSERPGNYIACAVHPDTPKGR